MKNYEKPVVMVNEGLAEGVYAASGSACWNVTVARSNGDNVIEVLADGSGIREFQVDCYHINSDSHRSHITVTITFTQTITGIDSSSGANASGFSGNTAWFTWDVTTYNSGEGKGYTVKVSCAEPYSLDVANWKWECLGVGVFQQ